MVDGPRSLAALWASESPLDSVRQSGRGRQVGRSSGAPVHQEPDLLPCFLDQRLPASRLPLVDRGVGLEVGQTDAEEAGEEVHDPDTRRVSLPIGGCPLARCSG